LAPGNGVDCW